MSALVHELGSRRDDDPLCRGNDCLPRSIGGLKGSICGHHQPDDGHLERLSIEPRRRLKSISDAAQDSIGDVEISEPVSEKFLNGERFDYAFFPHDDCPLPKAATLDHFQNGTGGKEIRFRVAPVTFNSKAADGRGIPPAAPVHHDVGQRRNHHNSIQASAIASATPHPMASKNLALSDIGNSFGSAPRAIDSDSQSVRFAAATVRAISSSTRRTPASVPGRVRLSDQL